MKENWIDKAVLFELLSLGLSYYDRSMGELLVSGEYAAACADAIDACDLGEDLRDEVRGLLAPYEGLDAEEAWHEVRLEHTKLFIGSPTALVSPYAGIYYAESKKVTPVLYVNTESMTVERFMKRCGIDRQEGTNEPMDHIGAECEFLNYLCLDRAGCVNAGGGVVPEGAYEEFYSERFVRFAKQVAELMPAHTEDTLLLAMSAILLALPETPL